MHSCIGEKMKEDELKKKQRKKQYNSRGEYEQER
jgi:hypothetical protein